MIRLQKLSIVVTICFFTIVLQAQTDPYQSVYASAALDAALTTNISDARANTSNNLAQDEYVSESFLDAKSGFVGIVFSDKVTKPSIYYKIVDANGREIYSGSAHANQGSNPTLYYNTQNLPSGNYRMFIENDNFFMSRSFTK